MSAVKVTLNEYEWQYVGIVFTARQFWADAEGRDGDRDGRPANSPWLRHFLGAASELAAAKALNRYYNPGDRNNPFAAKSDVGECIQVRSTFHADGHLIVHDRDRDDHFFVLVTVDERTAEFDVVGWIMGMDAKQERFLRLRRRPEYWVPQSELSTEGLLRGEAAVA